MFWVLGESVPYSWLINVIGESSIRMFQISVGVLLHQSTVKASQSSSGKNAVISSKSREQINENIAGMNQNNKTGPIQANNMAIVLPVSSIEHEDT